MARQKNLCKSVKPNNRLCKNYCQYDRHCRYYDVCHIHKRAPTYITTMVKTLLIITIAVTIAAPLVPASTESIDDTLRSWLKSFSLFYDNNVYNIVRYILRKWWTSFSLFYENNDVYNSIQYTLRSWLKSQFHCVF